MKILKYSFILLIIFVNMLATAQTMAKFENKFNEIDSIYPKQTIYLQTDKEKYTAGETIWYKLYILNPDNLADYTSSQINVEIINPEGKIAHNQILKINNGKANGSLHIADTTGAGNYKIRAYTNFILNFGDKAIFSKKIEIKNKNKTFYTENLLSYAKKKKRKRKKLIVEIYPECNHFLSDIENNILITTQTLEAKNIDVFCEVFDNKKHLISSFTTSNGFYNLKLTPKHGKQYFIKTKYNKRTHKINFPESEKYKFIISKQDDDTKSTLSLKISTNYITSFTNTEYILIARIPGKTFCKKNYLK